MNIVSAKLLELQHLTELLTWLSLLPVLLLFLHIELDQYFMAGYFFSSFLSCLF